MSDFDNTNRGALFKNTRKEEGDRKPEYNGSLNIDGVEYFLDAWLKTSQAGAKFMSVSVKRKDKQPVAQSVPRQQAAPQRQAPASTSSGFDDMSDDPPF